MFNRDTAVAAIGAVMTILKHEPQQVVILSHPEILS